MLPAVVELLEATAASVQRSDADKPLVWRRVELWALRTQRLSGAFQSTPGGLLPCYS